MARSVYVASVEGHTAKSVIALGALEALRGSFKKVGVFRAISPGQDQKDRVLELLLAHSNAGFKYQDCIGVSYQDVHDNHEKALSIIVDRFKALEAQCDAMLIIGSDYTDVASPTELSFNARIAANIAAPMLVVLNGREINATDEHLGQAKPRALGELVQIAQVTIEEIQDAHVEIMAAVVNRADPKALAEVEKAIGSVMPNNEPVWAVPEEPLLVAPRMSQVMKSVNGKLTFGDPKRLDTEALGVVVAAMSAVNVLPRLSERAVAVVPSDRTDVLLSLLMADDSETFPNLAGIVLNGGFELPEPIVRLVKGLKPTIPVISASKGSFDTTMQIIKTRGFVSVDDAEKLARAKKLVAKYFKAKAFVKHFKASNTTAVTPLLFEHTLVERARAAKKHIVLPEGSDDRILMAADQVLAKKIAKITILGDQKKILTRAKKLGLNLSSAKIISIRDSEFFEPFVTEYTRLRASKGMTIEQARKVMLDDSYFGTMMVHTGIADGMVSGAVNTTAHTIKPGFEIIKTKPGVSVVSSVFLMALSDRVLVYGDCAVIPEPTSQQLADIAISSAQTARAFDIEPQVAMLSYSTGDSGSGVDVDKVREATQLVHQRAPKLSVEGPIQYDAAVDFAVAAKKLPGSSVAGRATVFVFPDLNTGNNTYKAVQRTAGAVAIGPILQGLNKPINDLSRGALVPDIVNTIAITAIQAATK